MPSHSSEPRIVFFGTPEFAVPSLTLLLKAGRNVVGVVSSPDAPVGRSRTLKPSPVALFSYAYGIPVLKPETLRDDEHFRMFSDLKPDLSVVVAYGKLIPARFLEVPRFGFLNVHPSLLPRWRGASPVQSAISSGDDATGVSIIKLDEQMDHGPVMLQQRISLDGTEYRPDLESRLSDIGANLLLDAVSRHIEGVAQLREQNHSAATVCGKVTRQSSRIAWTRPARDIANLVRAMAGEPVAWTGWNGTVINILKASAHPNQEPQTAPGTVLGLDGRILVDTSHGTLELELIQPAGKKPMPASAFANGHRDFLGSVLE